VSDSSDGEEEEDGPCGARSKAARSDSSSVPISGISSFNGLSDLDALEGEDNDCNDGGEMMDDAAGVPSSQKRRSATLQTASDVKCVGPTMRATLEVQAACVTAGDAAHDTSNGTMSVGVASGASKRVRFDLPLGGSGKKIGLASSDPFLASMLKHNATSQQNCTTSIDDSAMDTENPSAMSSDSQDITATTHPPPIAPPRSGYTSYSLDGVAHHSESANAAGFADLMRILGVTQNDAGGAVEGSDEAGSNSVTFGSKARSGKAPRRPGL